MRRPEILSWLEPESHLELSLERVDETVVLDVGTSHYEGRRWLRFGVRGVPSETARTLDPSLDSVDHLEETWCVVDCGDAGIVVVSHSWRISRSICGPHWARDMALREGPGWLFDDLLAVRPGSGRHDVLALIDVLPVTPLGQDECDCESDWIVALEAEDAAANEPSIQAYSLQLGELEPTAIRLASAAVSRLSGDLRLVAIRGALLHVSDVLMNEYTGDSFTTDSLRLLCEVDASERRTRMVISFSDGDIRDSWSPPQVHAQRVLSRVRVDEPASQIWLIAPRTSDVDALGRGDKLEPAGAPLYVRPSKVELPGWQAEWARPLFGDALTQRPRSS